VRQLTHPNPLIGVFTMGMINKVLKTYSDSNFKVTPLDTRLLNGLYQRKRSALLKDSSFDDLEFDTHVD